MSSINNAIEKAIRKHSQGDENSAAEIFREILETNSNQPLALEYIGIQEIKKRNYSSAINLLEKAIKQKNCRISALFQLGHAYRDNGELSKAEKIYEKYLLTNPGPNANVTYADLLLDIGKAEAAKKILSGTIKKNPDFIKALCMLAKIYEKEKNYSEANKLQKIAVTSNHKDRESLLIKGSAFLDLNQPEKAFKTVKVCTNSLYGEELNNAIKEFNLSKEDKINSITTKPILKPIVLACGDPLYVKKYAPGLIKSIAKKSPDTEILIHTIIPKSDIPPPKLNNSLPNYSFTWRYHQNAGPATFAAERFIQAEKLLRKSLRQIIIIDIDSILNLDILSEIKKLPTHDVAMRYRNEEIFINQRVAAGYLSLSPTRNAQNFINSVAAYIVHFQKRSKDEWFIDQMALLASRYFLINKKNTEKMTILDVPDHFLDWKHYNKNSILWTTKGKSKSLPME